MALWRVGMAVNGSRGRPGDVRCSGRVQIWALRLMAMPTRRRLLAATFAAATALTGAATNAVADTPPPGDIPDSQAFVTFSGRGYSLKTPEGWGRTANGSLVTFADKFNSVRVETMKAATKPTVASVKQRDVPALKASAKGFALRSVTQVARPAGAAILITYRAASAGQTLTVKWTNTSATGSVTMQSASLH